MYFFLITTCASLALAVPAPAPAPQGINLLGLNLLGLLDIPAIITDLGTAAEAASDLLGA